MEVRSEADLPDISSCLSVNLEEGAQTAQMHTTQAHTAQMHTAQMHATQAYTSQTQMGQVDKTHTDNSQAAEKQRNDADIEGYFRVLGKDVQCRECNKVVKRSEIRSHHQIHMEEKPYECETCFKRFSRSDKLVTHKKIHSGERPYQCFCSKRFLRLDHLKTHVATHNLSIEDSQALIDEAQKKDGSQNILLPKGEFLVCPFCTRKFAQSYKYNRHMRLHTGEKPYHCCCGAKYARSERLHRHLCEYPDHWQIEIAASDQEKVPLTTQEKTSHYIQGGSDFANPVSNARTEVLSPDRWQEEIVSSDQGKGSSCIPSVSDNFPVVSNPRTDISSPDLWQNEIASSGQDKASECIPGVSDNYPVLSSPRTEVFSQNNASHSIPVTSCNPGMEIFSQKNLSDCSPRTDVSEQMDIQRKHTIVEYAELLKSRLPRDTTIRIKKKAEQKLNYPVSQPQATIEIQAPESRVVEESGKLHENEVMGSCVVKEEVELEKIKREEVEGDVKGEETVTLVDNTEEGREGES